MSLEKKLLLKTLVELKRAARALGRRLMHAIVLRTQRRSQPLGLRSRPRSVPRPLLLWSRRPLLRPLDRRNASMRSLMRLLLLQRQIGRLTTLLSFRGGLTYQNVPRACADLFSRVPCHEEYDFSEPNDLVEDKAYRLWAGSAMELITHSNLLALSYERRVRRFAAKLEGYSAMRAGAEQVLILRKRLADHVATTKDLSEKATDARKRMRFAEEELDRDKTEKESLLVFYEKEMARLRAFREHEVNQDIAQCDDKLQRIKKSICDSEQVHRLSSLMGEAVAIKDYLTSFKGEGVAVPEDKFKDLEENFKKFEAEFEALDVEEVTETDFRMIPPCPRPTNPLSAKVETEFY